MCAIALLRKMISSLGDARTVILITALSYLILCSADDLSPVAIDEDVSYTSRMSFQYLKYEGWWIHTWRL